MIQIKKHKLKLPNWFTKYGGLIISSLFFICGAIAFFGIFGQGLEMYGGRNWISTEGKIISSSIETTHFSRGGGYDYLGKVQYEFTVDGKIYKGDTLSLPNYRESREEIVIQKLAPYPAGAKTVVYYDPTAPDHSALIQPVLNWIYLIIFIPISLLIMLVSLFMLKASWDL
jgi:hypothetical protein